jgi:putative spermidine/putrescine transport system substrate-binding protein
MSSNRFRKSTIAAAVGLAFGSLGAVQAWAVDLTVVSWGGAYTQSQLKAYHEPYMAENPDVKLNSDDYSGGLAEVRAQAEAGNVTWDLVDAVMSDAITACDEGLADEIDHDALLLPGADGSAPTEDFLEGSLSDCFIPQIVYSTVFAYNTEAFPDNPPQTIADVFDLEKFPGKRSLQKVPTYNLEWALMADGVPVDEVYDVLETAEGVDRAFAKLDTIKDQVVWWTAGAQPPQLLADKEVVIASAFNGRLFDAEFSEKQPIKIIWNGQALDLDGWMIPSGGEKKEAVYEFVKYATDTQRLADQAKYISYGPARKSSLPSVGEHAELGIDMAPHMPTNPANMTDAFMTNFEFWADNKDSLSERFQAWLSK